MYHIFVHFPLPLQIFKNLQEIVSNLNYLQRSFNSILRSLVGFPIDLNVGFRYWLLAEKVLQQLAYQRANVEVGEGKQAKT